MGELKRLFEFAGITWVPDDALEEAVEFSSFDRMKRMEAENTHRFTHGSWSKRDPENPESFKVRRGKVGGYKEYLSVGDEEYVTKL